MRTAEFDLIEDSGIGGTLGGESLSADFRHGDRVLELHTSPVRDTLGRVVAGLVLALDKTKERGIEGALRRSEQVYRAIVKNLPNGSILLIDRDLRYVAADGPLIAEVLRMAKVEQIIGRTVMEVASDANRDALVALYASVFRGERRHAEVEREGRFFELDTAPIYDDGRITHALVALYDNTEQKREAESLRRARTLLDVTLENIEDGVALLDSERRVVVANEAFGAMFGFTHERLQGLTKEQFIEHVGPRVEDPAMFEEHFWRSTGRFSGDFVFVHPHRRVLRRSWAQIALPDGEGFLVTWHDVTAERDLLMERERQLVVDALTGIPNRRAAESALHVEHERMKRAGAAVSVAIFDVDHFKKINDEFGHATGDEVLRRVAATLSSEKRLTDTVARWGGEEFLAVLEVPLQGARAFSERARRSIERLRCPPVERVTISVGVAQLGPDEVPAVAVARADARLYEAKRAGRNQVKV